MCCWPRNEKRGSFGGESRGGSERLEGAVMIAVVDVAVVA